MHLIVFAFSFLLERTPYNWANIVAHCCLMKGEGELSFISEMRSMSYSLDSASRER